jgi:O-methyltransferase
MIRKIFKKSESMKSANTSEQNVLVKLQPFTMGNMEGLKLHQALAKYIREKKVEGDIVECGVYNGGSSAAMANEADMAKRRLWMYDSFEGMPDVKEIDGADAAKYVGQCVGEITKVEAAMNLIGLPKEKYVIKKGWFNDTFQTEGPQKIALLHIDSDWYDSVIVCLDRFYDLVEEGGVILLDDFGHWEGCRNAFYDFVKKRDLKPLVERRGHTQLYWVKRKENNRDNSGLQMFHESLK